VEPRAVAAGRSKCIQSPRLLCACSRIKTTGRFGSYAMKAH
jgi:hypothetical protein